MFSRGAFTHNIKKCMDIKPLNRGFITIIKSYNPAVRFFLGKPEAVLEPGIRLNLPIIHNLEYVDIRSKLESIPSQGLILKGGVSVSVDGSVQWRIKDPMRSVINVKNPDKSVVERASLELRSSLGDYTLAELLSNKESIASTIKSDLQTAVNEWGIEIETIQLKDISIEESMRHSMAVEAEAERNSRAKVINAEADVKTAVEYAKAAEIFVKNPHAMRLREWQLLQNIANTDNAKFFFVPTDFMNIFKSKN